MAGKDYKSPIIQSNPWASKEDYGGNTNQGDETSVEEAVIQLQNEVRSVQLNMANQVNLLKDEIRAIHETIDNIHNGIHAVNEALSKQTKVATFLERRVDGVRTDTSTGIALSIIVFSVLFIISLFIR